MVLSDYLVADPRMLRDLHSQGVAHLPVRVRDGTGLVGPLVIPGVTSCLGCADLHRRDRDAAWPAVAAQLRDTVGVADRATLLATAALALSQVNRVIGAVRGRGGRSGAAHGVERHPGVRRPRRLDRGAAMAETSPVFLLTVPVASSMLAARPPSWMMEMWQTSNGGALRATRSWPASRSASPAGQRSGSVSG